MTTEINAGRVAMVHKGEWSASTAYVRLDVVYYNGSSYVASQDSTGQNPSTATNYWQLLARGVDPSNYYTKTETNTKLGSKQDALVSGQNIKTVNGNSLLGAGNLELGELFVVRMTRNNSNSVYTADKSVSEIYEASYTNGKPVIAVMRDINNPVLILTDCDPDADGYVFSAIESNVVTTLRWQRTDDYTYELETMLLQPHLVSGTNIKTVNNESLLGSGNVDIVGKSAYQSYVDTTTDSPVKTEAEWVASLKGEDGVSLGDVAIADNLTTDDATKVLSARQGYLLGQKVNDVDDVPTAGSEKFVKSGGVSEAIKSIVNSSNTEDFDLGFTDEEGNVVAKFENGHIKTKHFDSSVDASTEHRGMMSASDKTTLENNTTKLSTIENGAEVNDVETTNVESADFEVSDSNGNVLIRAEEGHIKTKNFDSSVNSVTTEEKEKLGSVEVGAEVNDVDSDDTSQADLEFSDEEGNVLMQLRNGHIKTKNFDSSVNETTNDTIEYPVFIGKGLDSDGATVIDSDNTLLTPLIRVSSGDIVHIEDVPKIDSIAVYEYSSENSTSFVASSNGFITDDYTIQSSSATFIRIVGKPKTTDPLFIDGVIYGNSAFVNNVCVIHKKEIKDNKYYLASFIPSGWYVSSSSDFSTTPENEDPWENTGSSLTLKHIYDKLQELATSYPEYFHLTQIGYDSADGKTPPSNYGNQFDDWLDGEGKVHIPVYKYELVSRPVDVEKGQSRGNSNSTIPTIYMDFGLHAGERPCMRAMLNMFIHLCRDWKDNAFLSYLRWNCRIVGIPMVCPYSYIDLNNSPTRNGRCNSNGVNINRNFYCNGLWNSIAPDTGGLNDKGSSPLSEIETKYVSRLILENADAIAAFSWHTHGVFTSYNNITRIETGSIRISDLLNSVGIDILRGLTVSGFQNHKLPYPLTDGSNYVGQVTRSAVNSVSNLSRDIVLPTSCPECMYRYYNGQSVSIYNTYLDCMNEEFVTNMILCALRQYFNNK